MKRKILKSVYGFILLIFLIGYSTCDQLEKEMLVSTGEVTDITINSADVAGSVIDIGENATQHGHCYGTSPNVTVSGSNLTTQLGEPPVGGFTTQLADLYANTKYYVKAYISNGQTTVYGKEISFTTLPAAIPTLTTTAVTSIASNTASGGGNITSDGGSPVTARGVCWSITANPLITGSHTSNGTGTGTFDSNMDQLISSTKYYVRAYATNGTGTAYGNEVNFTSAGATLLPPVVSSADATLIANTSATLNGSVNPNDLSATVTFEYGLTTSYGAVVTALQSPVLGRTSVGVSADIIGLQEGKTYHFRVKASSTGGATNGSDLQFTTLQPPAATTQNATNIAFTTARLNGTVNANNSSTTVTFEYGPTIAYGTTVNASPLTVTGNAGTTMSADITGLTSGNTYHFRVKAVSVGGTSYGTDFIFTTSLYPTVTGLVASDITFNTATLNCSVNPYGNSTDVSFEYGTTTGYGSTVTGAPASVSGNVATPVSGAVSVVPSQLYHFRVKTVYLGVTTYSGDASFTSLCEPPITATSVASPVTATSATLNGSVFAQNFSTTLSFEYGLTTAYGNTIAVPGTATGSAKTIFSGDISGLTPATTYHFRTKAVNCGGADYGSDQTFTTNCLPPTAVTGNGFGNSSSIHVEGFVNANGCTTTVTFEYQVGGGTTGTVDAVPNIVNGTTDTNVSVTVGGAPPFVVVGYRVIAVSSGGITFGEWRTLTTTF